MKTESLDNLIAAALAVVVSLPLFTVRTAEAEESGSFTVLHSYVRNLTV